MILDLFLNFFQTMQVFKFGGASVKDAQGIRNVENIVRQFADERLFVVISAMGKTTNHMESVHSAYIKTEADKALQLLEEVRVYHYGIMSELGIESNRVGELFDRLKTYIISPVDTDFDRSYDFIVHHGELLSTMIISHYLNLRGLKNLWLDMPHVLITDQNHREANVIDQPSRSNLASLISSSEYNIFIAQGFVGGSMSGEPTTLGREGSDYTAAVVANLIDAQSVTIWKDVPGVMNADPKLFDEVVHIPELSYYDAVELAYSGAQIIHPKTIRPLENKNIPLYVKPFNNPQAAGSVIKSQKSSPICVPVYILRKNQVLVTIRPNDFSFVLEPSLSVLFQIIEKHKLKVSLIQSSAVTISVCVDNSYHLEDALNELRRDYNVTYNVGLNLLTVRGTTPDIIADVETGKDILLEQRTRRTIKIVYRS